MSTPVHAEEPALAPDNRVTSGIAFTIFAAAACFALAATAAACFLALAATAAAAQTAR